MINAFLYPAESCPGGAEYVDCSDPNAKRRVDSTCSTRNIPNFGVSGMASAFSSLEFFIVSAQKELKCRQKNNYKVILFITCLF